MALNYEAKQAVVAEVSTVAQHAISAVAAEYRGLTVEKLTALRIEARNANVYLRVVKNTLAKRAMADTEFECLTESLKGPLILAFSQEEPSSAARILKNFAKTNEKLVLSVGAVGGTLVEGKDIEKIASLPTKDEAIAQLMSVMIAPVTKLARTLSETYAQVVRVVSNIGDKKKEEG